MASIRDVAKKAEVSIGAVSEILKGNTKYSDATVEKVWNAVNELGYHPNPYVQKIFAKESPKHEPTGLILHVIYTPSDAGSVNSTKDMNMLAFEHACIGENLFGVNTFYRHQQGFRNQLFLKDLVDGAVLSLPHTDVIEIIKKRIPAVLTNVNSEPEEVGMPVITMDLERGYDAAFQAILSRGYGKKMAILRGFNPEDNRQVINAENLSKYMEISAKKAKIGIRKDHIIDFEISTHTNELITERIADRIAELVRSGIRIIGLRSLWPPQLIKKFLSVRGIRVPEDAVLVVVSDYLLKEKGVVSLVIDRKKLMQTAVRVLMRRIEGKEPVNRKYLIPCKAVETDMI